MRKYLELPLTDEQNERLWRIAKREAQRRAEQMYPPSFRQEVEMMRLAIVEFEQLAGVQNSDLARELQERYGQSAS